MAARPEITPAMMAMVRTVFFIETPDVYKRQLYQKISDTLTVLATGGEQE